MVRKKERNEQGSMEDLSAGRPQPDDAWLRIDDTQPRDSWSGLRRYAILGLTVFLTFWARFVLAGRNSYWLDELYSVERYVAQQDSVIQAIRDLAQTSIHPPLYQAILYYWVQAFGDSEVATRSLSNLYASLATIFVHQVVVRISGRIVANISAIAFAITYLVTYYGLEARSYAQSLALATLSSLAILVYIHRRELIAKSEATSAWIWTAALLVGANLGLLLTHYYNAFFVGAQALFAGAFFLLRRHRGRRVKEFTLIVGLYLLQFALFAAMWGRVTIAAIQNSRGREEFVTESVAFTPQEILRIVTAESFDFGPLSASIALIVMAVLIAWAVWGVTRRQETGSRRYLVGVTYLVSMTVGAPLLAYLAFEFLGAERFRVRYMLYLVPGMTILLVLVVKQVVDMARAAVVQGRPSGGLHHTVAPLVLGLVMLTVIPGSIRAATSVKVDWRGTAQDVVAIVESNPGADYVIFETAFRSTPVFDYYLRRYSDDVRVTATIRRFEEQRGTDYSFQRLEDEIEAHDFLIIPFVHHRVTGFPVALQILQETYAVHHCQINDEGRGIVIFDVSENGSSADEEESTCVLQTQID